MSRRTQDNIVAVLLLCVFAGLIMLSLGYSPRARLVPLPVAVFGALLVLIQLVWQNLRSTDDLQVDLLDVLVKRDDKAITRQTPVSSPAQVDAGARFKRESVACAMVVVFLSLTLLLGPMPAIFVFTAGYFVMSAYCAWLRALIFAGAFTTVLYLLFVVALQIQLYHGILETFVDRW
jgi:hypothetical protein